MNTTKSDLMKAIRNGELEIIKEYLHQNKMSDDQPWAGGYALLRKSIEHNHTELSILLLNSGSKVNSKSPKRNHTNTALHFAVQNGDIEIIQMLINRGAYLNVQNKIGWTPIIYAVVREQKEIAEMLLRNGASVYGLNNGMVYLNDHAKSILHKIIKKVKGDGISIKNSAHNMKNSKITPQNCELFGEKAIKKTKQGSLNKKLHSAVRQGSVEYVTEMLNRGSNVNAFDKQKLTPLFCAVKNKNALIVELLLNKGANFCGNKLGISPLHIAVDSGAIDITKILLKAGALANSVCDYFRREYYSEPGNILDSKKITPLHIAAQKGFSNIIEVLCEYGADVNSPSSRGYTALHLAVVNNKQDCIIMLLKYGSYVDAKNSLDETPLHIAGFLPAAELLLNHGALINSKNYKGFTPFHKSVIYMQTEMIKLFLRYNADVNCCANNKMTPLLNTVNSETAKLLLNHGADVNVQDMNGNTILNTAVSLGCTSMVDVILKNSFPDKNNQSNKSSLKVALMNFCNENIIKSLLDYGFTYSLNDINDDSLYNVVRKGYDDILNIFLELNPRLLHDFKNVKPLHVAVRNYNFSTITLLLANGADINEMDEFGKVPIFYSIKTSNFVMTEFLLKYEADVKKWPELLILASKNVCKNIVEILLQNQANTEGTDEFGRTALHITAVNECKCVKIDDRADIARLLLQYGANVDAKTRSCGLTTLHLACLNNHIKLIKILLKYKANIECFTENMDSKNISEIQGSRNPSNIRNIYNKIQNGQTPLHLAAKGGNNDVIYILLHVGANICARDINGSTPLHVAAAESSVYVVRRLVYQGADIDEINKEGQTALHIACTYGKYENVKFLLNFGSDVNIETYNNESPIDLVLGFIRSTGNYVDYGNNETSWGAGISS
ncbi:ankyrin-1-like isoform X2 [Episyrphus balteatus]|uniref:ankyrin-1-like isoform X2 n=1 Tax=Episyrphus balteatus TaxID=286459 RepID=UPI0024863962|nr:ankyrin-1-like isoform X2 [Episyrphus balteatus]